MAFFGNIIAAIIKYKAHAAAGAAGSATVVTAAVIAIAHSDQKLTEYKQSHQKESDLKMEIIDLKFKHQEENASDLKYGLRIVNENLLLGTRGEASKMKKLKFDK